MSEEHYAVDDSILPVMEHDNPVEIRIDMDDEGVTLRVGLRDWHWPRGCPDIDGAGTALRNPIPCDPDNFPEAV
jgi:hypothetical protein